MRSVLIMISAATLALAGPGPPGAPIALGPGKSPGLSKEDAEYLDGLFRDFLFDPKGATRVRVTVPVLDPPDPGRPAPTEERDGWLVRGSPARVYFTDGGSIPAAAASRVRPVAFVATCRRRYAADGHLPRPIRSTSAGRQDQSDLAAAAWLYRLGHDDLAARALAAARSDDLTVDPREELRATLARRASEELVDAFCRRADAEALDHGERLYCLYPDLAGRDRQAGRILADLARRQRDGTFGRTPPAGFPPWFPLWDPRQKLEYLIASLDQIDTESRWQFTYLELGDRRYDAVVRLGELAVPALLDVIENDRRLTRLAERYRGERTGRVISVRERAEAALRDILGVREFAPTGGAPTRNPGVRAAQMRGWWETYGKLPPDERMMRILTHPRATRDACLEAAENLARSYPQGVQRWGRSAGREAAWPSPAAARFRGPTVAEAILAALDRRPAPTDPDWDSWERAEYHFLNCLVELGDRRVAGELSRRAREIEAPDRRRLYALAAHRLGASAAWVAVARDFERGALPLARGPGGRPDRDRVRGELASYLEEFGNHPLPDTDRALYALGDPAHPYYRSLVEDMLADGRYSHLYSPWHQHPACLAVLRTALDDAEPTGRQFYLRGEEIEESGGRPGRSGLPADRPDPAGWAEHVEERTCDAAAARITEVVVGVPPFHPLHRDAAKSLPALKAFLDSHGHRFRRLTEAEVRRYDLWGDPAYVPDIRRLGRPATAADVAAGRAVFHLDGKGRLAGNAPAVVVLKATPPRSSMPTSGPVWLGVALSLAARERPGPGLVVQAEVGPDGSVIYGVIFRHAIRAVRADEVEPAPPE